MPDIPVVRVGRSLPASLRAFSEDRLRYLDEAAALGPVAGLRFGPSTVFVVTDAELARRMLVTDAPRWSRPPAMRFPVRLGVGESIFTQSDRAWSVSQPVVAPAFRSRALSNRLVALDEIVERELATFAVGAAMDLGLAMGRITLSVAAWVFLGERLSTERAEELADHQRKIVGWVGRRLGALSSGMPIAFGADARRMRAHRRVLEGYVDGVIDRAARAQPAEDTVLGMLLAARRSGRALDRTEVRGQLLGLMLAGNETTAAALSWVLVHAAQSPTFWTELRHAPERSDAFVAETLRVNPPAWGLTRSPTRGGVALHVDGRAIRVRRPGVVTVYLRGIQRDAAVWRDPTRFDPGRHFGAPSDHARHLIPFGLGPRGCIGQHLALAELRAITPALARHGDVVIPNPVEEDASFSLRPKGGLHGRFVEPASHPSPPRS